MTATPATTTVLVTGGAGYLGRWCIRQLLHADYAVRTTVRQRSMSAHLRSLLDDRDRLSVYEADLHSDEGWNDAVAGCDFVLHVASPFPSTQPRDPDELIAPARDGTLRVLRAAFDAGVRRVVVTSSSAAVRNTGHDYDRPLTEKDWADSGNPRLSPYARSKLLAEQAAWGYAERVGQTHRLAVINPGAIIGPLIGGHRSYSLDTVERLLTGRAPAIPRLGFAFVDVRDVAELHCRAMTAPQGAGQRFLGTGPFMWMADIAAVLRDHLGPDAAKVPKRVAPNALIRLLANFDANLRPVVGELGRHTEYSTQKARSLLDWTPRPIRDSILECAQSILSQSDADPAARRTASLQ